MSSIYSVTFPSQSTYCTVDCDSCVKNAFPRKTGFVNLLLQHNLRTLKQQIVKLFFFFEQSDLLTRQLRSLLTLQPHALWAAATVDSVSKLKLSMFAQKYFKCCSVLVFLFLTCLRYRKCPLFLALHFPLQPRMLSFQHWIAYFRHHWKFPLWVFPATSFPKCYFAWYCKPHLMWWRGWWLFGWVGFD